MASSRILSTFKNIFGALSPMARGESPSDDNATPFQPNAPNYAETKVESTVEPKPPALTRPRVVDVSPAQQPAPPEPPYAARVVPKPTVPPNFDAASFQPRTFDAPTATTAVVNNGIQPPSDSTQPLHLIQPPKPTTQIINNGLDGQGAAAQPAPLSSTAAINSAPAASVMSAPVVKPSPVAWLPYTDNKGKKRNVQIIDGQVVDEAGNNLGSQEELMSNKRFARDVNLRTVDDKIKEARKDGASPLELATLQRQRAQIVQNYTLDPEKDTRRDWKDILKGIALGGLKGIASGNLGAGLGGAIAGGLGSAINPNVDDALYNQMFKAPQAKARYEQAVANEKAEFEAQKVQDETLKRGLDREKLMVDIESGGYENISKAVAAREGIVKSVIGDNKGPLSVQAIQQIDAKLKAAGFGPSGFQPGVPRGETGTIYVNKATGEVGRVFSDGTFLNAFAVNSKGERVPLIDMTEQTLEVYGTDGKQYGPMKAGEFTKTRLQEEFKAREAQAKDAKEARKEAQQVINVNTKEIDKLDAQARKIDDELRIKQIKFGQLQQDIQIAEQGIQALLTDKDSGETFTIEEAPNKLDPNQMKELRALQATLKNKQDDAQIVNREVLLGQKELSRLAKEKGALQKEMEDVQGGTSTQAVEPQVTFDKPLDANGVGSGTIKVGAGSDTNGFTYKGGIKKGADGKPTMEGKGETTFTNGVRYVGDFKNGDFNGKGTYTWPDGTSYSGDFVNGAFEGKGKRTWPDGRSYSGTFKADKPNGQGTMTFKGETYEGDFVNGNREGKGKYTFASGAYYEAEWKAGAPIKGVIHYVNGDVYTGELGANGAANGKGELVQKGGQRFSGTWKDGKLVK